MDDLNSVIKQLDLSRDVLISSCRTFDDIRPTFLYFIDKATATIEELQEFKDYFENIESLTYNAKLDQSSVDILLKYNEFVANSKKERLSKYLEEVGSTLDEHYDKFKRKIRDSEGVWLSRKVFWWLSLSSTVYSSYPSSWAVSGARGGWGNTARKSQ